MTQKKRNSQLIQRNRNAGEKKFARFIKPMLATLIKGPFDDKDWIFEKKWDGFRAIAEKEGKKCRLYSRNGLDFSTRFESIFESLRKIEHDFVVDGEIVWLSPKGLPDFQKLQQYENGNPKALHYYVFDLLKLNGKNTESLPLSDRKMLLKEILSRHPSIRFCEHVAGNGIGFFKKCSRKGYEGIICKNKNSTYIEGKRSRNWLKVKNQNSTESVIVGYTEPKGSRKYFGSLLLANREGKHWIFRGHVGTGFSTLDLASIYSKLKPLETGKSPLKERVPVNEKVTWVKPKLVADIGFTEVTEENIFRHPVFLRLRDEKSVRLVNDESLKK